MTRLQELVHFLFHNSWMYAGGETATCRICGITRRCGWARKEML